MVSHIGPLLGLQLTEASEDQFGCEICGKSFKSNKSLATHKGHHVRREEMPSMKSVKSRTSSGSAHSIKTKVESTNIDPVSMGGAIASQPTVIELPRIIPMPSYPLRTHSVPQPQPVGFGMMFNQNPTPNTFSTPYSNRKRTRSQMEAADNSLGAGLCVTEPIVIAEDSEEEDPLSGRSQVLTTLHEHPLVGPIKRMRGYKWDCDNKECPKNGVYKMHSSQHWKSAKVGDECTWCNKCVFEHLLFKGDCAHSAMQKKRKYGQLMFKCPECGFEAKSPSGLGSHRRKIHGVRGRFSKLPREPASTPVAMGPVKGTTPDQRGKVKQGSVGPTKSEPEQLVHRQQNRPIREHKPINLAFEDSSSDSSSSSSSSGGSGSSDSNGSSESSDDGEEGTSTESQRLLMAVTM